MIIQLFQETPVHKYLLLFLFCCNLFAQTTLQVERYYTTSAAEDFPLVNLFDTDTSTYWKTISGTGPEEGIMLYFKKPTLINGLQLKGFDGSKVYTIETYINGKKKDILYNREKVRSLFIKFNEETSEEGIQVEDRDYLFTISSKKASKKISAHSIVLLQNKKPLKITLPKQIPAQVAASSTLKPQSAYNVQNLFDGRKEFTWCEGSESDGVGESIAISFTKKQLISGFRLYNGYQRSKKHFTANGRVKQIEVKTPTSIDILTLKDSYGAQDILLAKPVETKNITITVLSVYSGSKYKDLCLSELSFLSNTELFSVQTDAYQNKKRAENKQKYKGTHLGSLLDRVISKTHYARGEGDLEEVTKLILRSDNTFVYYSDIYYGDYESKNIVADGNWSFTSSKGTTQHIRLFGQWLNVTEIEDYYSNESSRTYQLIFQDKIAIKKQKFGADPESGSLTPISDNSKPVKKELIVLSGGKFLTKLFAHE